ncbi:MAG: FAD-dependent oxidoreductase [Sphingobium phenoxybenzoativorans]
MIAEAQEIQGNRLLTPVRVGTRTLKNRVAITCHVYGLEVYDPGESGDSHAAYIARRAEGPGLIGITGIVPPTADEIRPGMLEGFAEKFRRLADIVHEHGGVAVIQILGTGAKWRSGLFGKRVPWKGEALWAFSPVQSDLGTEVAHAMSSGEIESLIEGWGVMSEVAVAAGLDGIELHGAQGYLLQQSISPWMNFRKDKWGEPLAFYKAVLDRTRAAIGPDGILGLRYATDDLRPLEQGGLGRDRLREIAVELVSGGQIDYVNPSEGSASYHYSHAIGTYRRPHGDFLPGASALRQAIGAKVPVIGVGRITNVDHAEAALARGDCDIVGLTRAHIADPDIVKKLFTGERNRIRPCVGANTGCIDRNALGLPVRCFHNPEAGRESEIEDLSQVDAARRILVVGAGPAGLKAAEIAARRGHHVVIMDKRTYPGGRLATITDRTSAYEMLGAVHWIGKELELLGVEMRLGTEVNAAVLESEKFDSVILATGSKPAEHRLDTDGSVPVLSTDEAMEALSDAQFTNVIVHDVLGSEEIAVVVEQFAAAGVKVTTTTPNPSVGQFLGWTHMGDHVPRLLALGCAIEERTMVTGIADGCVMTVDQLSAQKKTRPFDALIWGHSRLPDVSLEDAARRVCGDVHVIGDANAPRDAMLAFLQGETAGRAI